MPLAPERERLGRAEVQVALRAGGLLARAIVYIFPEQIQ